MKRLYPLRARIVGNLARLGIVDKSFNPRFYNVWEVPYQGCVARILLQRYCNGRRRGQTNFIRVTLDGKRMPVRALQEFANFLTDEQNNGKTICELAKAGKL